jgi:hypothetical protein
MHPKVSSQASRSRLLFGAILRLSSPFFELHTLFHTSLGGGAGPPRSTRGLFFLKAGEGGGFPIFSSRAADRVGEDFRARLTVLLMALGSSIESGGWRRGMGSLLRPPFS